MSRNESENKRFLAYYKEFKDKIYTYFLYRVNFDKDLAEDLTSEVFIKAFDKFNTFESARSFQAWIYAISRNHLINHYRCSGRELNLASAENIPCEFLKKLEARMELKAVFKKIQCLAPYYRDVLLLRFVDGLDNREIADVLQKEEGAVRTQLSRALAELKKLLNTETVGLK